jgi:hypothetical protein
MARPLGIVPPAVEYFERRLGSSPRRFSLGPPDKRTGTRMLPMVARPGCSLDPICELQSKRRSVMKPTQLRLSAWRDTVSKRLPGAAFLAVFHRRF